MTHHLSLRPAAGFPGRARTAADVPASATHPGAVQALRLLRTAFTVAPIVFWLDKSTDLLTTWEAYLAPWINDLVPGTAHQAMLAVGVVEVIAGLLVAVRPDLGGYVVAAWLAGIVLDLVTMGEYLDVALRDVGLLAAALAMARLAQAAGTAAAGRPARGADPRVGA